MSHWVAKGVFMKVADFSDDENRSVGKGILSSVTEVWLEYIENAGDLLYTLYLPQTTGVDGFLLSSGGINSCKWNEGGLHAYKYVYLCSFNLYPVFIMQTTEMKTWHAFRPRIKS